MRKTAVGIIPLLIIGVCGFLGGLISGLAGGIFLGRRGMQVCTSNIQCAVTTECSPGRQEHPPAEWGTHRASGEDRSTELDASGDSEEHRSMEEGQSPDPCAYTPTEEDLARAALIRKAWEEGDDETLNAMGYTRMRREG